MKLLDPEASSREIAADRTKRIDDNIAKLTHPTLAVREAAFTQLLREGDEAREPLLRAAIYGDPDRAVAAMQVLEARKEPGLAQEFVRRWERNWNRGATADLLARIGDASLVRDVAHFLDIEAVALNRVRLCRAVGLLGGGEEPALERASKDPVAMVSLEAIRNLRSIAGLLDAWRTWQDVPRRAAAAQGLARVRARAAVPDLVEGLADDSAEIRRVCAEALGAIGDARAVRPLADHLGDSSRDVFLAIDASLRQLTGLQPKEPTPEGWREALKSDR